MYPEKDITYTEQALLYFLQQGVGGENIGEDTFRMDAIC